MRKETEIIIHITVQSVYIDPGRNPCTEQFGFIRHTHFREHIDRFRRRNRHFLKWKPKFAEPAHLGVQSIRKSLVGLSSVLKGQVQTRSDRKMDDGAARTPEAQIMQRSLTQHEGGPVVRQVTGLFCLIDKLYLFSVRCPVPQFPEPPVHFCQHDGRLPRPGGILRQLIVGRALIIIICSAININPHQIPPHLKISVMIQHRRRGMPAFRVLSASLQFPSALLIASSSFRASDLLSSLESGTDCSISFRILRLLSR